MYNKFVLDNGLRVIISPMPHARSICLAFLVGAGSCFETEAQAGISHFIEHLYFKGTQRRPSSKQISQDIEGVGGIINASTDKEITIFFSKVASSHFSIALDVLSDIFFHSRFDSTDIEQERKVILGEINMNLDSPQQRVGMIIDELLWPGQALGREILGTKDTLKAMGREQILEYVPQRYLPGNTVVSIAGGIRSDQAMSQIEPLFRDWKGGGVVANYATDLDQKEPRVRVESRDTEQAHLYLAAHGLSQSDPRRFSLDLLNVLLGEGMSSRLFVEVRENRGLAYDIFSYVEHFYTSGSLKIYAGVDTDKVELTIVTVLKELDKLKREITMDELTRAKEMLKGRLQLRLESSQNVALWLGGQEMLRKHILLPEEIFSIVDAITVSDVQQVACDLLVSDKISLAAVGPIKDEEPLRKLLAI
ncbi:MAG: pitrilysin family protein [Chloroflexota bacterium]|nr:pitrilysin family protein [Chloroflexota bacterium]